MVLVANIFPRRHLALQIVASNIMYVVGQYPSFLRAHWRFLKTVVFKLVEFMHEQFPGVQEMAVDTFLRITQKCKRKFVVAQNDEPEPFLRTLIADTKKNINHLDPLRICTYYESLGLCIAAAPPTQRAEYIRASLEIFDEIWQNVLQFVEADGGVALCQNAEQLKRTSLVGGRAMVGYGVISSGLLSPLVLSDPDRKVI